MPPTFFLRHKVVPLHSTSLFFPADTTRKALVNKAEQVGSVVVAHGFTKENQEPVGWEKKKL